MKIFKKQIAEDLLKNGFNLVKTEVNRKYPNFVTFVFTNSDELFAFLKEKYNIVLKK